MDAAMDLKELHDELLESAPSGVEHDAADCPLCADQSDGTSSSSEGGVMSKTYSQDELDAAVAAAVKPLEDSLQEFKASMEQSEVEQRHAKEKAELEASIAEIQAQLDSATLKAGEADKKYEELVAFLEAEQAKAEAAAEIARRREERLAVVKQVASTFSDEYMEANADRWAAMADEDFAALTEDWKNIAAKAAVGEESEESDESLTGQTAMTASRNDESGKSGLRDIFDLTLSGVDPRTVH